MKHSVIQVMMWLRMSPPCSFGTFPVKSVCFLLRGINWYAIKGTSRAIWTVEPKQSSWAGQRLPQVAAFFWGWWYLQFLIWRFSRHSNVYVVQGHEGRYLKTAGWKDWNLFFFFFRMEVTTCNNIGHSEQFFLCWSKGIQLDWRFSIQPLSRRASARVSLCVHITS